MARGTECTPNSNVGRIGEHRDPRAAIAGAALASLILTAGCAASPEHTTEPKSVDNQESAAARAASAQELQVDAKALAVGYDCQLTGIPDPEHATIFYRGTSAAESALKKYGSKKVLKIYDQRTYAVSFEDFATYGSKSLSVHRTPLDAPIDSDYEADPESSTLMQPGSIDTFIGYDGTYGIEQQAAAPKSYLIIAETMATASGSTNWTEFGISVCGAISRLSSGWEMTAIPEAVPLHYVEDNYEVANEH